MLQQSSPARDATINFGDAATSHVIFWSTYDVGKPRVRSLLEGAHRADLDVTQCDLDVWGIPGKSQFGLGGQALRWLRWLSAYPRLVWWYRWLPAPPVVLVPYLSQLDVLVRWMCARLRGARILWDGFLSLYGALVTTHTGHTPRIRDIFSAGPHVCLVSPSALVALSANSSARPIQAGRRQRRRKVLQSIRRWSSSAVDYSSRSFGRQARITSCLLRPGPSRDAT